MTISRAHVSTHRGDVIYLEAVRWPVNCFTGSRTIFNLILSASLGATDNAHILDINVVINWQLSKQGIPLTGITWANRGLRFRTIKVTYFFEVIRWQGTGFQMIAGSSLIFFKIHMKYVVFKCRTIKILISNWPRTRKFSQLLGREDSCFWLCSPWSRVGHALRPIITLWLVKIWQVSSCGKFMQHLERCLLWELKLTEFCVNLWCF